MKPAHAALALGALAALFFAPVRAQVCDVRPIDRRIRPCITENQECSPPPSGLCITTPIPGSPPGIDCICTGTSPDDEEPPEPTPQPEPERPKKKKCLGAVSQVLVPDVPGLPSENTLVTYTTLVDPANVARAFIDEQLVAAFFGTDSAVEGEVTLYYGSFADPARVPVELVALSIRLPSVPTFGFRSGPQVLALPTEGLTPATLVYNADERYLVSSPQLGIELAGDSRFALGIEAVVTIYAAVAPDGVLHATAVGIADAPLLAIPNPQRISVGDAGRPGSDDSLTPDISAGGRYVVISSASPNFVANDTNGLDDVFLRDRATGALFRVSQTAAGGQADGASFDPAVSADGRFVAFTSMATNLDPADAHLDADVYLYNAHTRQLRVLSRPAGGGAAGAGSFRPDVSDDGRYVAFSSRRDDLVMGDDNGAEDVFVYEIATGALRRVSVDDAGGEANGDSRQPALSADGRYVVFHTLADDLFAADGNSAPDVVVHDRDVDDDGVFDEPGAIATIPVSVTSGGAQSTPNFVGDARITPDGRFVVFHSDAQDLGAGAIELAQIFVHDRDADGNGVFDEPGGIATVLVSRNAAGDAGDGDHLGCDISADGRFVVFSSDSANLGGGAPSFRDVFLHDRDADADGVFDESDPNATVTRAISVAPGGSAGNDDSGIFSPVRCSADGQVVVFETAASNILADDLNASVDVVLLDRAADTRTAASLSPLPIEGNDMSLTPALSADGRYVAFMSYATNFGAGENGGLRAGTLTTSFQPDGNGFRDIFVRDRATAETFIASISSGGDWGDGESGAPVLSDDGRYVAFESAAENLVADDDNSVSDIFVHDLLFGDTVRVSVDSAGSQADDMSFNPGISADGRIVAFVSYAKNLVPNDGNQVRDVFVHDRDSDENGIFDEPGGIATLRVSLGPGGVEGDNDSGDLRFESDGRYLSRDGRYVAFTSLAGNLVAVDGNPGWDIFVHDRQTGSNTLVSASTAGQAANKDCKAPSLSGDGRYVTFQTDANTLVDGDNNTVDDVFLHDRDADGDGVFDEPGEVTTERISIATGGAEADAASGGLYGGGSVSLDGRYVAFASLAANLDPNDANNAYDVFVRDRTAGATHRLSRRYDGTATEVDSRAAVLSRFGRFVALESDDGQLVTDDTNAVRDVFLADRRGPRGDLDNDGDVDFDDAARFFACLGGPDNPAPGACPEGVDSDFDADGDTDLDDFADLMVNFGSS